MLDGCMDFIFFLILLNPQIHFNSIMASLEENENPDQSPKLNLIELSNEERCKKNSSSQSEI